MNKDLQIGSPEEIAANERFEALRLEPTETYNLPDIAEKLANGKELNEIERQMAAGTIRDWIRLKKLNTGRPKKWNSIQEKNKYYNDKRRGKLSDSTNK